MKPTSASSTSLSCTSRSLCWLPSPRTLEDSFCRVMLTRAELREAPRSSEPAGDLRVLQGVVAFVFSIRRSWHWTLLAVFLASLNPKTPCCFLARNLSSHPFAALPKLPPPSPDLATGSMQLLHSCRSETSRSVSAFWCFWSPAPESELLFWARRVAGLPDWPCGDHSMILAFYLFEVMEFL